MEQKEAGMILAARFSIFTGDYPSASRIAQKLLESCNSDGPSTPFELEALCIDHWVTVIDAQSTFCEAQSTGSRAVESEIRKKLLQIDNSYNARSEPEIDSLMMRVRGKQAVKQNGDALNILNQVKIIIIITNDNNDNSINDNSINGNSNDNTNIHSHTCIHTLAYTNIRMPIPI